VTANLNELVVLVNPSDPLSRVISGMALKKAGFSDIVLVVDGELRLHGVINYADVLRALESGKSIGASVSEIMTSNPIVARFGARDHEIIEDVRAQVRLRSGGTKETTRFVPLVDRANVVRDVVDFLAMLARNPSGGESVEIFGLGFVGLTLAVALASKGHSVTGFDTDPELIRRLKLGENHVHEHRLGDMMYRSLNDGSLEFRELPDDQHRSVRIVAVGTPVDAHGIAKLEALESVVRTIGSRLQRGDLVMVRSTVPVGTTRTIVQKGLEGTSGLKAGNDFALAFTPERTVAGTAIQELSSLPQIVGGLSESCAEKAMRFWQTLTPSVIRVDGLEAAELVKLANNSFRDLSFAFANAFALLADSFNLDASRILAAANDGYPRDRIPLPSPGVGGSCLAKDPYLYAAVAGESAHSSLAKLGREVNAAAGRYPLQVLQRFARRTGRKVGDLSVFLVGLAFKGQPETNDVRNSVAVEVGRTLVDLGCSVRAFDAVVEKDVVESLGFTFESPHEAAIDCDAMLILNNHPSNVQNGVLTRLSGRRTLLFDGWSLLDPLEVERCEGITYANMGYMTPIRDAVS